MKKAIIRKGRPAEEVDSFLEQVRERLQESPNNLYILKRTKSEDKTFNFMVEYGLTSEYICEKISELNVTNYCYTDENEGVPCEGPGWIFGQTFLNGKNGPLIVYIKLKLASKVICISFHPEERDLRYPYL